MNREEEVPIGRVGGPPWHCPIHSFLLVDGNHALRCPENCVYEVRGGIPRFVPISNYADSFGSQWNRHRETQLDSYTGLGITGARARRNLGEQLWESMAGLEVLEAGCGAGRFTEILLQQGAFVTSVDISTAVSANAANIQPNTHHRVAQADIMALPLKNQAFDVVFCLGVLQHTPDPKASIASLYSKVKPGGWLVIDHYTYNLSWYTKTAPLFRTVLRRLKPETGFRATDRLVDVFFPLHTAVRNRPIAQKVLSRVSPIICYYHAYPDLPDALQREWSLLDTHDSLTDWHRHLLTARQTRHLFEQLGADTIRCERRNYVVEARVRRPVDSQSSNSEHIRPHRAESPRRARFFYSGRL